MELISGMHSKLHTTTHNDFASRILYLLTFEHISPQVLIDLNADPNRANKFGMTPLHHASVGGDAAIVQQLMDVGARPNAADEQG